MGCQLGEMVRKGGELTYNCITVLELITAKFAILTFTKRQSNIAIYLMIGNKTGL